MRIISIHLLNEQDGLKIAFEKDNPFEKPTKQELSILKDGINNMLPDEDITADFYDQEYFSSKTANKKNGLTNYEEFSKTFPPEHSQWVEQFIPKDVVKQDYKIHEIGCAFGWTVDELRRRGYDASGSDISKYVVEKHPRDYITQKDWSKNTFLKGTSNLIYSLATFEHISLEDVRLLFANIQTSICVGGILFATIDDRWGQDLSHVSIKSRNWWNNIARQYSFEVMEEETNKVFKINGYVWRRI